MIDVNAVISNADVRFLPDMPVNQIELKLHYAGGDAMLRIPMDDKSMYSILNVFNKDSVGGLKGEYCRMLMDETTGRVDSIRNILYDDFGEIQDNPIV